MLGTIEISDATLELVMQGMSEVTAEGGTAATTFADYPIKVGGKTGSAEMTEVVDTDVADQLHQRPVHRLCAV